MSETCDSVAAHHCDICETLFHSLSGPIGHDCRDFESVAGVEHYGLPRGAAAAVTRSLWYDGQTDASSSVVMADLRGDFPPEWAINTPGFRRASEASSEQGHSVTLGPDTTHGRSR